MKGDMGHTSDQEQIAARRMKRTRAVRLSPEGIAVLENHLEARWKAEYPEERLTRPLRAELLGISVRTADRLLSGGPVDRSSVTTAFARTGCTQVSDYLIEQESFSETENEEEGESASASLNLPQKAVVTVQNSLQEVISDQPSASTDSRLGRTDAPRGRPTLGALYWALVLVPTVSLIVVAALTTDWGGYSMTSQKFRDSIQDTLTRGHDAFQRGEYGRSEQLFYEAIEKNQTARDTAYFADAKRGLANIAVYRGEYLKALEFVNEAMTLQGEFDAENPYGPLNEMKGDILMKLGKPLEAEKCYRSAIVFYGRSKDPMGVAMVQGELGSVFTKTGRLPEAEAEISSSLKWLEFNKRPREIAAIKLLQASLRIKQGRAAEAVQTARDSLAFFAKEGHKRWMAKSNLILGTALLAAKKRAEAERCFEDSNRLYSEIQDREGQKAVSNARKNQ